jgi:cellulose synthase/poly-beta-1,6-N-acetylglucosamine synthase-like glycosyltransferase
MTITSLYIFIFAVASLFPYKRTFRKVTNYRKFAVLIPCYQEDEVIIGVIEDALHHNYPDFDLVVIADNFSEETIQRIQHLPIILFSEKFDISTKTRAINFALRNLPDNKYDAVVILDGDNLMKDDFLLKVNASFDEGFVAIQGHRIAKNTNTRFALLDAVSEEINNSIFRKGHRVIGLSSALIGSAMAFKYDFFKKLMSNIEVVGGFDKLLELTLLKDKYKIEYLPDAYVFDEKVQNAKVFTKQRRRWLSAQFHYFGIFFIPSLKALLFHGNIDFFNKAFQHVQLPRILLVGLLFFISIISLIFNTLFFKIAWVVSFFLAILALLFSVPRRFYNFQTLKAMAYLPAGFLFMAISLLRIRGANKHFIHTKHTYNAFQIKRHK